MKIIEHGTISRGSREILSYHGWPSVCRTDGGALLAVCSGRRMAHACPFGKTVLFRSADNGKTWSPPIIVNDSLLDDRDAGILNAGGNRIIITWFNHNARFYKTEHAESILRRVTPYEANFVSAQLLYYDTLTEEQKTGGSSICISDDGGETWGASMRVPVSSPHGPVRLQNGDIFYLGKELAGRDDMSSGPIAAYISADRGETWEKQGEIEPPKPLTAKNFHEPHAVQLPSGRILGAIRSGGEEGRDFRFNFNIFMSYSDDGGETWTRPALMPADGSPPHLLLHSSGAVICVFGRRREPLGQRAVVSCDGGATWSEEMTLFESAPDGDLGYPCTAELDGGELFTVYYQKAAATEKPSLMFTRWRIDDGD